MILCHHRYRTRDTSWFYVIIVAEQGIRQGFTSSSLQNKGYVKVVNVGYSFYALTEHVGPSIENMLTHRVTARVKMFKAIVAHSLG